MPWKIPESEIEAVKQKTDLVALVQSRGISLQKHGTRNWRGLCPFHDDKETPNFIVTPSKGLYHCMSCGAGGDVIRFVERHDGLSFRHAFELLKNGGTAAFTAQPKQTQTTVPKLPCPVDVNADDATLCSQVTSYYHERLKSSAHGREYLRTRGLDDDALIDRYRLGFADRTLGLRLPESNRVDGAKLRTRLLQVGLWRESGHEHFNGCIVVPLFDGAGTIVSFYGRRTQKAKIEHFYPEGPHRGLFNLAAFESPEIILCEAVIDALTFCRHGFANATCIYGTEGMTEEIWERIKKARRVLIAYDADNAGERAAERDTVRLKSVGVDVGRVRFPWGQDANSYALKVQPAAKSLGLLLQAAAVDAPIIRRPLLAAAPATTAAVSAVTVPVANRPLVASSAPTRASSSLAAFVSSSEEDAAKEKSPAVPSVPPTSAPAPVAAINAAPMPAKAPVLELRGVHHVLDLEGREYRVTGLDKAASVEVLKVTVPRHAVS